MFVGRNGVSRATHLSVDPTGPIKGFNIIGLALSSMLVGDQGIRQLALENLHITDSFVSNRDIPLPHDIAWFLNHETLGDGQTYSIGG